MRIAAMAACAGLVAVLGAPLSAATDATTSLTAAELEQTVLRAQMPLTLGDWDQERYGSLSNAAPYVCLTGVGEIELLPRARDAGMVAYSVGEGIRGDVWIFQYSSRMAAASALASLRAADCPPAPKVEWGDGVPVIVDAVQGSRFTGAAHMGIEATVRFPDPQGVRTYEHRITTQRGLAVIQTTVALSAGSATVSNQRIAERLDRRWHKQVVAAYQNFGVDGVAR